MIGLDFETYGGVELPRYGLHRYVNNPTFKPLLAGLAWLDEGHVMSMLLDLTEEFDNRHAYLATLIDDHQIVAHNAQFEQAVLGSMGLHYPSERFIDSAVLARAAGAAGKLEVAAPQLLGVDKMEAGLDLIKLFSIPGMHQEESGSLMFDRAVVVNNPARWDVFGEYCALDAELSLRLALELLPHISEVELANMAVTMDMNNTGWHVDIALVEEMHRRYLANIEAAVVEFAVATSSPDLNFNSSKQLAAWCRERGVRATSFDEAHVERLLKMLSKRVASPALSQASTDSYNQVIHMLQTKQLLGGSSLKKLQVILDTTSDDGRLRDQYLHIGAGASYRTTGRGVQMQNLKRLHGQGDDMSELFDPDSEWDNGQLASNLRQVFTATDPNGQLIVGDFASVESRGLAWQAGEQWKLNAYQVGADLYRVQAGRIFGIDDGNVTKDQRQIGKVGELACGYGAGGAAVKDFAGKMGVDLTEGEATKLVKDWRDANPCTVQFWYALDDALHGCLDGVMREVKIPHGQVLLFPQLAPKSLREQTHNEDLWSVAFELRLKDGTKVLHRVMHGVHEAGRSLLYWKPTERKTGNLWSDTFTNPKTKQLQRHSVWGGKLAGLLTQSLCRELFFDSLRQVHWWVGKYQNVALVGQFHDEIVVDWTPGNLGLAEARQLLTDSMQRTTLPQFPLAAEVKSDYRYVK